MSIVVVGAGGHAKVVVATLEACGIAVAAIYDDDPERHGARVLAVPVVGASAELGAGADVRAVLAIGDNVARKRVAECLPAAQWVSAVHPSAVVHQSVEIGPGTVVFAGAVIQPGAVIGRHVIVNTGAAVDHDCRLADFSHVGPGARLSGNTVLEEGAFLGTAASTRQGVRVGAWTTVGVGAAVVTDLPPGVVAVGIPARPR